MSSFRKYKILINNLDDNTLLNYLKDVEKKFDKVKIFTAFFSDSGIIENWVKKGLKIKLLVSLRFPTNPESLKILLPYAQNIDLKFLGTNFHSKGYIFYKGKKLIEAIIGSSNFTDGGLCNNIETNILIKDKDYLSEIENFFKEIWNGGKYLTPSDINKYEKRYSKDLKNNNLEKQKQNNNLNFQWGKIDRIKPSRKALEYYTFWRIVDEIKSFVEKESYKEWPNIPIYLCLDHFWHFVVVVKKYKGIRRSNKEHKKRIIINLFKEFIDYNKDEKFTEEMFEYHKKVFYSKLNKKNIVKLTKHEAKLIYRKTHAGGSRSRRFNSDKKFVSKNDISKIRNSLKYLLWDDEDDITERINNLLHNPKYKLAEMGSSLVQELLGWVQPDKMPLRNEKADKAVKLLGYEF